MRTPIAFRSASRDYLAALLELSRLPTADERRAAWRQSMATLAHEASAQTPVPLEGLPPDALQQSARIAIAEGLLDDLGFLEPSHAAAALYEFAAALPPGPEKRELGRRVLRQLHEGDAPTFVALATSLALGARRGLAGPSVRARVALSLDLPIGAGANADALALALVSRRELVREWLTVPSTGSLPSRRLAARLLERAAREAARRAAQGDDAATRVFEGEQVAVAWSRLLADREPLVWRHVATARGLLSDAVPRLGEQIGRDLRGTLSPTEWRRAAASLASRIAVAPRDALERARLLLDSDVPKRDPGVGAAMILGLARAAEVEPAAADELLELCVRSAGAHGVDVAEVLVELRRERVADGVGAWAIERVRAQLRDALAQAGDDDGRSALVQALQDDLAPESERGALTLRERIGEAQRLFVDQSARDAYFAARDVAGAVLATVERLERADPSTPQGRQRAFRDVRELDTALLETSALSDLLLLGTKADAGGANALSDALARLADWLLTHEAEPVIAPVAHITLRLRQLRALLHLVDADGIGDDDANKRRVRATSVLLGRARDDAAPALRRTLLATLARATDGLVREEICEMSDVFVALLFDLDGLDDLGVVAEASMGPDLQIALRAYIELARVTPGVGALTGLFELARALPAASSPRVEALRAGLLRLAHALMPVVTAEGLDQLAPAGESSLLLAVETTVQSLAQLLRGARRRLGRLLSDDVPVSGIALRLVEQSVDRAATGRRAELVDAVAAASAALSDELPRGVAAVIVAALTHVVSLPATAPEISAQVRSARRSGAPRGVDASLPPWLPPSRTIGGFYILRALGRGAGGTVFIVKRADERHDNDAEQFALKVPDYDGAAARTLSEKEFHRLFREEAGALLALPAHPNLATLVTFDAGARPKPVLVMELVQGPSLERRLEQQSLDLETAFRTLEGIAAGLEAMHAAEIGHLDVKPSNIILRPPLEPAAASGSLAPTPRMTATPKTTMQPVLVDFGLAGRKVRPGCATAHYGAPEIWGLSPKGHVPRPADADVYAFACVAYEVLTGRTLFDGTSEVALLTAHLSHDGLPDALAGLARIDAGCSRLVDALSAALRRDPRERLAMRDLRAALANSARELAGRPWPLGSVGAPSTAA